MPDDIKKMIKTVAPGTLLREGLENVLRTKSGGLIVVGTNSKLLDIIDGGFTLNCKYTPNNLYELAKMDGAIILNNDATEIIYANTQLLPERALPSDETGIRHRTAERVAQATGKLVISISQRRNIITIYKGKLSYELDEISVVLTRAMQAVNTLERYKSVLTSQLRDLSIAEFEDNVTGDIVVQVMQKYIVVKRLNQYIEDLLVELGTEGGLVKMQLADLVKNVDEEIGWFLKDYQVNDKQPLEPKDFVPQIHITGIQDVDSWYMNPEKIFEMLGYIQEPEDLLETKMVSHGHRILSRIPELRAKKSLVKKIVEHFERFPNILVATVEQFDEIDGIGTFIARSTKNGLRRIREDRLNIRSQPEHSQNKG